MATNDDHAAASSHLGPWLRAARMKRNTTESELAHHLGTEQSMLAMIERGEAHPAPALAEKIRAWIRSGTRPARAPKRGPYLK